MTTFAVAMAPDHALARRSGLRFADVLDQVSVGVATTGLMDRLLQRQAAFAGSYGRASNPGFKPGRRLPHRRCRPGHVGGCRARPLHRMPVAGRLALVPLLDPWAQRHFVVASRALNLLSPAARLLAQHLRDQAA